MLDWFVFKPYFEPVLNWDWLLDRTQVTTVGAQLYVDGSVITTGTEAKGGSARVTEPPVPAPLPNVALYAQHVWRFRYGSLNVGARGDLGILGSALSPRGAVTFHPAEHTSLKLIFSSAFRNPTIVERYLEVPDYLASNPNISPEHVYSGELALTQQLGAQTVMISLYAAYWERLIRAVDLKGTQLIQFINISTIWSAGINAAWSGRQGPFDWAVSLSYAPGRYAIDESVLAQIPWARSTIDANSQRVGNFMLAPVDAASDFYATAHVSFQPAPELPRLSVAANVNSPRPLLGYGIAPVYTDPRFTEPRWQPWSVDVRTALEGSFSSALSWRLLLTTRNLNTGPLPTRNNPALWQPAPGGGHMFSLSPVPTVSLMAEVSARF